MNYRAQETCCHLGISQLYPRKKIEQDVSNIIALDQTELFASILTEWTDESDLPVRRPEKDCSWICIEDPVSFTTNKSSSIKCHFTYRCARKYGNSTKKGEMDLLHDNGTDFDQKSDMAHL
jgi:hypothetical protein